MITYLTGDIFDNTIAGNQVTAIVNPVNTVGVMGKGLALAFKQNYPDNFNLYKIACQNNEVKVGQLFITKHPSGQFIVNFPTKQHWRGKSQLSWITQGLLELKKFIIENQIQSIAIPALGSGLGGLDWQLVKNEIDKSLQDLIEVKILVFEPK